MGKSTAWRSRTGDLGIPHGCGPGHPNDEPDPLSPSSAAPGGGLPPSWTEALVDLAGRGSSFPFTRWHPVYAGFGNPSHLLFFSFFFLLLFLLVGVQTGRWAAKIPGARAHLSWTCKHLLGGRRPRSLDASSSPTRGSRSPLEPAVLTSTPSVAESLESSLRTPDPTTGSGCTRHHQRRPKDRADGTPTCGWWTKVTDTGPEARTSDEPSGTSQAEL